PDRFDVATQPESKRRHHSITRHPAMGPLSGFVAGSFSWSSRPPAFARQVARSHRDFVRFGLALPSFSGTGRPATGLWSGPESTSWATSCQLSEELSSTPARKIITNG